MKCKNIFRARIFSPFQGRYRSSGRGVAGEGFLNRLLIILLFAIIILYSCEEENPPPAGSSKIEFGSTAVSKVEYHSAEVTSAISELAGNQISGHGHCWATEANPTTTNEKTSFGSLTKATAFTSTLENLQPNTTWYVRSWYNTGLETVYGAEATFTTWKTGKPVTTTGEITAVTTHSAVCSGTAINDSGLVITEYGLVWDTLQTFTLVQNLAKKALGDSLGSFNHQLTNLIDGKTYYIKSYAKNTAGTSYGETKNFTTIQITPPTINTTAITNITTNSASSGGEVTNDGHSEVTARGIVWGTEPLPTLENHLGKTENGTGIGTFTSQATNLQDGTTYYVRAYATNERGTGYGEAMEVFTVEIVVPTVTTKEATNITTNSAESGGEITDDGHGTVTARGIVWSKKQNPTTGNNEGKTADGEGNGSFSSELTGLDDGETYYIRAYATNEKGTGYGQEIKITTTAITLAEVTTTDITNITSNSARTGGVVTNDGNATVTSRGVCWSSNPNPTINDYKTEEGSGGGSFTSEITSLLPGQTYYVRAYAINSEGTAYGNQNEFTTESVKPTVTTTQITNISVNSATGGGTVTSDGGVAVTARGICWSTNPSPTIYDDKTESEGGVGAYNSQLTNLIPGETYYVRAYATNSKGTSYGEEVEFTTGANVPKVTTTSVTDITTGSAMSGGNVTSEEGAPVTARGIVWSTSPNPTVENNLGKTTNGTGPGSYTSELTELQDGTTYYVRAYATNIKGTSYSETEIVFSTIEKEITDIDGNIYQVKIIGTQVWMTENLKVTRYNDNNEIDYITDANAWVNLDTGGFCWMNFDNNTNAEIYGALYNWEAVNSEKLCPKGWHVPTKREWEILNNYLGNGLISGGKMKSIDGWISPNSGASNSSGFTALPGGRMSYWGTFAYLGTRGFWWTSTVFSLDLSQSSHVYLINETSYYYGYEGINKKSGLSVRCIKD